MPAKYAFESIEQIQKCYLLIHSLLQAQNEN